MSLPAPTPTTAEQNRIDDDQLREAKEIVAERWMDDPEQMGEFMREWFAEFDDAALTRLADMILYGSPELDDPIELMRVLRKHFDRCMDDALRESKEVYEEWDYLGWASKCGL